MLISIHTPFADLRSFLPASGQLPVPQWPDPDPDKEFVRAFGPIRIRPRGGAAGWNGEHRVCELTQGIKFERQFHVDFPGYRVRCAFRRIFHSGTALMRVDFGFGIRGRGDRCPPVNACFGVPLSVRTPSKDGEVRLIQPFFATSHSIGFLYLHSTTMVSHRDRIDPAWIVTGRPVCVVEFAASEQVVVPEAALPTECRTDAGFALWHYWLQIEKAQIGVWLIRHDQPYHPTLRAIRVNPVRRSAEIEALRKVLNAVLSGALVVAPRSMESQALQKYLASVHKRLRRIDTLRMGPSYDLESYANQLGDQLQPGERNAVLHRLEAALAKFDIRPNILKNTLADAGTVIIAEEIVMGNKIDARGAHGIIGIDVAIGTINNNFNQAMANTDPDLKDKLEALKAAIEQLIHEAPDKAEDVSRDFDTFAREATASKPRKSVLQSVGQTLVEAASTVTKVASAVAAAVGAVVRIFH